MVLGADLSAVAAVLAAALELALGLMVRAITWGMSVASTIIKACASSARVSRRRSVRRVPTRWAACAPPWRSPSTLRSPRRSTGFPRVLGWTNAPAVDNALRSIRLSASHCAALVLLGDTDLVPIAHALHRRALGTDRPFVVCDPRRRSNCPATVRSPVNHERGVVAFRAAIDGSLCLHQERTPDDLPALATLVRGSDAPVQLIVLAEARYNLHPFLLRPAPIRVPPLSTRTRELSRIVDEYMRDAMIALDAGAARFTDDDRKWVLDHAATTLAEIEKRPCGS